MLEGRRIAVFDAEIKKPIEACSRGWQSHDEMGLSCLVIFDYESMRYRVFDDRNIAEALAILTGFDYVVGFNTVNFDWKLLKATYSQLYPGVFDQKGSQDFDILREIWVSLNLNPDVFVPRTHGGYKLDDVARETIGLEKSGNGANAPILYQEGRIAELIDYCVQDVKIEKELFEFIVRYGYVVRNGKRIPVYFK